MITVIGLVAVLMSVAFVLRMLPHYLAPAGAGVDHWFWKTYIETYRRDHNFPPVLPQYVLDQHQWYPPVFPLLIAQLPAWVYDRWSHVIATVIDLLRMGLLLFVAHWQSDGNLYVMSVAGLLYATTPIQISYNIQLNPRGLGALFLDGILMLLLWYYSYQGPWWVWGGVLCLAGLILLTHKMTTQLLWFMVFSCAIIYWDWRLFMLVPGSLLIAMLLSKGFYWKVLLAHWDIVKFWNRHWRWIGADAVRESPIYSNGTYERPEKLHRSGLKGFLWHWFILFGFNPVAWIACLLAYERLFVASPFLIYPTWILLWLLLPCLFACITTFVPVFKCLGAGYLYVYNTSLLASLLVALTYRYTKMPEFSTVFCLLALTLNVSGLCVYYWTFLKNKRLRIDKNFEKILQKLKDLPRGVAWCLPSSWHEPVAYKTGHSVLYGGHGYGFKLLEPTFPRLLLPVNEIVTRYQVRYLLTMEGMLTEECIADMPEASLITEGEYLLYCFENGGVTC
jgi:hypothetical protein